MAFSTEMLSLDSQESGKRWMPQPQTSPAPLPHSNLWHTTSPLAAQGQELCHTDSLTRFGQVPRLKASGWYFPCLKIHHLFYNSHKTEFCLTFTCGKISTKNHECSSPEIFGRNIACAHFSKVTFKYSFQDIVWREQAPAVILLLSKRSWAKNGSFLESTYWHRKYSAGSEGFDASAVPTSQSELHIRVQATFSCSHTPLSLCLIYWCETHDAPQKRLWQEHTTILWKSRQSGKVSGLCPKQINLHF